MIDINIDSQQLIKTLHNFEDELQGKLVRRALTPAVKPIRDAMVALVRTKSGALQKAIGIRTLSKSAKSRLGVEIGTVAILLGPNRKTTDSDGVKRSQGYKAIWEEFGTSGITGRAGFPFMSTALDQTESGMQDRFYQGLQAAINKLK